MTSEVILPPPEIRTIVNKTAAFVAKTSNPAAFEEKIRAREKSDSRFAFLNAKDAYHAYYQQRLEAFQRGDATPEGGAPSGSETPASAAAAEKAVEPTPAPEPTAPPPLDFDADPPPINAVDLEIMKLTALFTARTGPQFVAALADREGRNYQFDFLRPSHSLYAFFTRLTQQYTRILVPDKRLMARIAAQSAGEGGENIDAARRLVLAEARERAAWQVRESARSEKEREAAERDAKAFAEIDWQDFVVASTIEFTEGDEIGIVQLPPPMALSQIQNMSISQKKMNALIMEGAVVEEEEEEEGVVEMGVEEEAEVEPEPVPVRKSEPEPEPEPELEPAPVQSTVAPPASAARIPAPRHPGIKIKKDYVPKANRLPTKETLYTTVDGKQIPVDEFSQHMRIELLDPKWKADKRQNEMNRAASSILPEGTNVYDTIKDMAAHRPDLFDSTGANKEKQEEVLQRSKAREAMVWDGHEASRDKVQTAFKKANLQVQLDEDKAPAVNIGPSVIPTKTKAAPAASDRPAKKKK